MARTSLRILLAASTLALASGVASAQDQSPPAVSVEQQLGVTVYRGPARPPAPPTPTPRPAGAYTDRALVGGERLWLADAATGRVDACYLRTDTYGDRRVRCTYGFSGFQRPPANYIGGWYGGYPGAGY
jgi:hypothetical protein